MCNAIMACNTIHSFQLAFVHCGRVEAGRNIHVFCLVTGVINYLDVWDALFQVICWVIINLIFDMPVNTLSQALALRTPAGL